MSSIISQNSYSTQNWLEQLASSILDPHILLQQLAIDPSLLQDSFHARRQFAQRVPISFIARMEKGNINDPLLRQVLPVKQESERHLGYDNDPLDEKSSQVSGLLHKYHNRALMILKNSCAVNCRYCFRRHFPYHEYQGRKKNWQLALNYIAEHSEINELILSGGDPLMAKDHELEWLFTQIGTIAHIKRVRIHSRLPVVIPARITDKLCEIFTIATMQIILVTHINHANEINQELRFSMKRLQQTGVTLLNQSVLLKGINDCVDAQLKLSEALFSAHILPYYLHMLDKVHGAAHFFVSKQAAREIINGLLAVSSGYLVPRLVQETAKQKSKILLDLYLE